MHYQKRQPKNFGSIWGDEAKIYHVGPCQFAHIETGDKADILVRAKARRNALLAVAPVTMKKAPTSTAKALITGINAVGNISPAEFIPLIENTSMARPLTDWVIRNAIQQAGRWHRQGLQLRVSINIAAANLEEEDVTHWFMESINTLPARPSLPSISL